MAEFASLTIAARPPASGQRLDAGHRRPGRAEVDHRPREQCVALDRVLSLAAKKKTA